MVYPPHHCIAIVHHEKLLFLYLTDTPSLASRLALLLTDVLSSKDAIDLFYCLYIAHTNYYYS